jgi:FixJ family two-component response regulator
MHKHRPHVAIVDDDESVRKALARLLAANSLKIETYGSAQEFLISLRARSPDCLLLDLHMPDVNGLDLQRHLNRIGVSIPTIIITAHNEIGLRERCVAIGASAFLTKPLNAQALMEAINAATAASATAKAAEHKAKIQRP